MVIRNNCMKGITMIEWLTNVQIGLFKFLGHLEERVETEDNQYVNYTADSGNTDRCMVQLQGLQTNAIKVRKFTPSGLLHPQS